MRGNRYYRSAAELPARALRPTLPPAPPRIPGLGWMQRRVLELLADGKARRAEDLAPVVGKNPCQIIHVLEMLEKRQLATRTRRKSGDLWRAA